MRLATHGYFEPDGLPSTLGGRLRGRRGPTLGFEEVAGMLPGLLSGLVLAGVNAEPDPGRDDGHLSAEEIQYLDGRRAPLHLGGVRALGGLAVRSERP